MVGLMKGLRSGEAHTRARSAQGGQAQGGTTERGTAGLGTTLAILLAPPREERGAVGHVAVDVLEAVAGVGGGGHRRAPAVVAYEQISAKGALPPGGHPGAG